MYHHTLIAFGNVVNWIPTFKQLISQLVFRITLKWLHYP
jgi:hypothetical protein